MATFNITVADKTYKVEIGDLAGSPVTVVVDGQAYSVQWERAAAAPAPVASAPTVPVAAAPAPQPKPVAPKPASIAPSGKGELFEISAPMPGKILKVSAKVGDKVKFGQQVCTLEAMKMESAIQSSTEGTVIAVKVSEGQAVQYGDVLVVLEKTGA
jgi:glutaconyl-CoA decarboxylase